LAPGKFGQCSWIPQILTAQIFCYYKFCDIVASSAIASSLDATAFGLWEFPTYPKLEIFEKTHKTTVVNFFLLVFVLFALSTTANHTTVSRQLARKQLLQHLFITLWQYNAKMILQHYALCPEDGIEKFSR